MKRANAFAATVIASVLSTFAATPPSQINYQGVLRDPSDKPLSGTYDMAFRFFDASSGGNEILVDAHAASGGAAVTVAGGLFNVALGTGTVTDGAGPGTYASLADLFRDYGAVWLQVTIGAETLSPRTQVSSAAYALNANSATNASNLGGRGPSSFLDTSIVSQTKAGSVTFDNVVSGSTTAITGRGGGTGGYFSNYSSTGGAFVGAGTDGIDAYGDIAVYGSGASAGVYGAGSASSAYGVLGVSSGGTGIYGTGVTGVQGSGTTYGVYGQSASEGVFGTSTGDAGVLGEGPYGVAGISTTGGACGLYGLGPTGVIAHSSSGGQAGYFADDTSTGVAYVGAGPRGIWAKGTFAGGTFSHPDNTTFWADVSRPTYKIFGTGTVSFVQNHPYEKDKVVVYAAPEGDEVAVYTRGSARLTDGEARVALGDTFRLVANPDLGLTAHLTPRGEPVPLSVASVSTGELVVRGPKGSDVEFDYLVYGLRIGFEDLAVVQPKAREAFLPEAAAVQETYGAHPELHAFNALERYKGMRRSLGNAGEPDLTRAAALAAAVDEHRAEIVAAARAEAEKARSAAVRPVETTVEPAESAPAAPALPSARPVPAAPAMPAQSVAMSPAPPPQLGVALVRVAENVRPGDVVVADPASHGAMRAGTRAADPLLAGVIASPDAGTRLESTQALVALAGSVVPCRVDAQYGAIHAGDLLTSSPTLGHAMRAADAAPGTILGKALEDLDAGTGTISILVMSR